MFHELLAVLLGKRWGEKKTNPKSPESKDNNDEVHSVGQEHEHIDVCHSAVLRVDQVVEELADGDVDLKGAARK